MNTQTKAVIDAARALMTNELSGYSSDCVDHHEYVKTCVLCGEKPEYHDDDCPVKVLADALAALESEGEGGG